MARQPASLKADLQCENVLDEYKALKLPLLRCRDANETKAREPSIPASASTGADPDKPSGPSENALVPLAGAEEDEMMQDVSEMAGGGQVSGQDALANLETTLRPVEKYAVRFLEEVSCIYSYLITCISPLYTDRLLLPVTVRCPLESLKSTAIRLFC